MLDGDVIVGKTRKEYFSELSPMSLLQKGR